MRPKYIYYSIIALALAVTISSCNFIKTTPISLKKTWVYVEIEIKTKFDTSNYYYYGQINQSVLDKISYNDNASGLFVLTDVRYYNDYDKIEEYKDGENAGIVYFRIQDIARISVKNSDPLFFNFSSPKEKSDSLTL